MESKNGRNDAMDLEEAKGDEKMNLANYKGIYFGDQNEKYTDDTTGAHFKTKDLMARLERAKV